MNKIKNIIKRIYKKIERDTLHSMCPQCFPKGKLTEEDVKELLEFIERG